MNSPFPRLIDGSLDVYHRPLIAGDSTLSEIYRQLTGLAAGAVLPRHAALCIHHFSGIIEAH